MNKLILANAFSSRNNVIELQLKSGGVVIAHNLITRVKLITELTTLDSAINPSYFDFTNADRLILKPKGYGLSNGRHLAQLVTYDSSNLDGFVWGNITLIVDGNSILYDSNGEIVHDSNGDIIYTL